MRYLPLARTPLTSVRQIPFSDQDCDAVVVEIQRADDLELTLR